jgi:hypothetical protein
VQSAMTALKVPVYAERIAATTRCRDQGRQAFASPRSTLRRDTLGSKRTDSTLPANETTRRGVVNDSSPRPGTIRPSCANLACWRCCSGTIDDPDVGFGALGGGDRLPRRKIDLVAIWSKLGQRGDRGPRVSSSALVRPMPLMDVMGYDARRNSRPIGISSRRSPRCGDERVHDPTSGCSS